MIRASALGDSHNFGRRVQLAAGRVEKPRTLLWEWLLLAAESPLRRYLDAATRDDDALGPHAFAFLPDLAFRRWRSRLGGEVERIRLAPLPKLTADGRRNLAAIVGRSLALFSWLGISDLHWENLVLGLDARERVIFAPLDIEMILSDFELPTETKLLPDADPEYAAICRHACGVRRVLPHLGKPVAALDLLAMAAAYTRTLGFLARHARAIAELFTSLPALRESPIRVCLRGTDEYVRARSEPLWPPLLDAEAEQLARGDIPYFFRLYGRAGIHYYADPSLRKLARLPLVGDVPKLDPLLQLSRGLRSPSRKKLEAQGLFALLGAFDDPSFDGRHHCDGLEVTFTPRSIVVRLPAGDELSSRRNLRAFVSSVYQPCRCGEVRQVFVPRLTRCSAATRG